jgi:uncharacterized protein YgiM (DUF1202 family)
MTKRKHIFQPIPLPPVIKPPQPTSSTQRRLLKLITVPTKYMWRRSSTTRACLLAVLTVLLCFMLTCIWAFGIAIGVIPDTSATETAEAHAQATTVAILALTPSSTPTDTPIPTNTLRPTIDPAVVQTEQAAGTKQALAAIARATEVVLELTASKTPTQTPLPTPTTVPVETWHVINAQKVNIRVCASENCDVLTTVNYGEAVQVITPSTANWQAVQLPGNRIGYIGAYYVSPSVPPRASPTIATAAPTSIPKQTRYVTATTVNLRDCAGITCAKVGTLSYRDSFEVTGQDYDSDGATWYSLRYYGQTAWIAGWLSSAQRPAAQPAPPAATQTPVVQPLPVQPPASSQCAGASAICQDGTCSYSAHRRGTCSHHSGVKQWLKSLPP